MTIRVRRASPRKAFFAPVDAPLYLSPGLSGYGALEPAAPTTNYKAWAIASGIGAVLFGIAAALLPASKAVRIGCGIAAAGLAGGTVYSGVKASGVAAKTFADRAISPSVLTARMLPPRELGLAPGDFVYSGTTDQPGVIYDILKTGGNDVVVEVRAPYVQRPDERYGGIDLVCHNKNPFWPHATSYGTYKVSGGSADVEYETEDRWLHLRPRRLLSEYPVCDSFQSRMPYDQGKTNRRWWANNLHMVGPDGSERTWTIHDSYSSAEDPKGFILDDRLFSIRYWTLVRALTANMARRTEAGFWCNTHNERPIPSDGGSVEALGSYKALMDISAMYMLNPNFCLFIKHGHFKYRSPISHTRRSWQGYTFPVSDDLSSALVNLNNFAVSENYKKIQGHHTDWIIKLFSWAIGTVASYVGGQGIFDLVLEEFMGTALGKALGKVALFLTNMKGIAASVVTLATALSAQYGHANTRMMQIGNSISRYGSYDIAQVGRILQSRFFEEAEPPQTVIGSYQNFFDGINKVICIDPSLTPVSIGGEWGGRDAAT